MRVIGGFMAFSFLAGATVSVVNALRKRDTWTEEKREFLRRSCVPLNAGPAFCECLERGVVEHMKPSRWLEISLAAGKDPGTASRYASELEPMFAPCRPLAEKH